jgi:hypothetical protein
MPRSGSITRIGPSTPSRYTSQLSPSSYRGSETPIHRSFYLPFSQEVTTTSARPPSSRARLPLRENYALMKAEVLSRKRHDGGGGEGRFGEDLRRVVQHGRRELAKFVE